MEIQFTASPQNCLRTLRVALTGTQAATFERIVIKGCRMGKSRK